MRAIIRTSLRFRLLVVAVAAGLLGIGVLSLRDAPVDVLPEFTPTYAEVQTEALGLSAEEVEELITVPLEADLLNGVEGIDVIRSESLPGLSSIVMVFAPGTDTYRARQLIQERLIQAHALPNVSKPPTLLQPLSSSSRLMMIGLSSEDVTPIEQSVIARWTMRPRLLGVPGVANVAVWGMRDQQVQVQVNPETLRDRDVTLNQVIATAGNAQAVSPLTFLEASTPGTGGFIETPQQRMQVRNVLDQLADPAELGRVPVEGTGGRLRLSDVSDVKIDHQPLIGDAIVDGGEGLLLVVEKFPGADTLEVTRGVEDALEKLRPGLSGVQTDATVFRPATFIEDATDNLTIALIVGGGLLALALAALLFQWRTVLVAFVAIPLSLVAAALVLLAFGHTINALTFAGLAIAIAVIVDEAVAGTEAIARRVREQRAAGSGRTTPAIVLDASAEVRGPLVYGTLIALLAILPVAVMGGRPGEFYEALVLGYVVAVLAATVVAFTVTPALSSLLLGFGKPALRDSGLLRSFGRRYEGALARILARPRRILLGAGAVLLAGLVALPFMGSSLVPSFQDRDVLVKLNAEPGTSNPAMTGLVTELTRDLKSLPGVDNVGAHVGRAVTGDQLVDVNSSEVWVSVASGADYTDTVDNIRDAVEQVAGVEREVLTSTGQSIRDVGALDETGETTPAGDGISVLTGADEPIVVRVYGENLDVLRQEANKVRELVAGVDGVVDPRIEQPVEQPALEIEVDLARAQRFGIKPGDVRRAEAAILQGIQVGSVFEDQKVFDVIVKGVPETRASVQAVRNMLIDRPGGGHIRLGQVADVREVPSPIAIEREAVSRMLDITAQVSGRGVGAVAEDIRTQLEGASFPLRYHAEVIEDTTSGEIGTGRMIVFAIAAIFAGFLLLQAAFRSWLLALLVAATLPVALAGGVLAALIDGAELTLGALGGLLAVLGLAARAAMVLMRRLEGLRSEGVVFGLDQVKRGAAIRFAPVVTAGLALAVLVLPFVAMGTRPGLEIVHPMAVVILGGLVTTLFVSLFVLPALYLGFGPGRRSDLDRDGPGVQQWPGIDERALATTAEPPNGQGAEPARAGEAPAAGGPASERESRP
jgi:CzcA family heavy metal efflux pump